ncbi:galactose mutarotase [Bacteroidaceae bacterium HV4-6-C5C]|nr:galactose mutarotase [Bacteroidaceae bacterium HV4-6-C5C]
MKNAVFLFLAVLLVACHSGSSLVLLPESHFRTEIDGKPVSLYTLTNSSGLLMQVTNWGARVVSLWVPDRRGKLDDIVLGYDNIDQYLHSHSYWGAAIGRFGNRIANGRFTLDGQVYQLPLSDKRHCLHGGKKGFDRVVWNVDTIASDHICFSYRSKDGEEGFPGNLDIKMKYSLTLENGFKIEYRAVTDKSTPINLTHHSLFNLKGAGNGSVESHLLHISADHYTPVDSTLIPIGVLALVDKSPFDFRIPVSIGKQMNNPDAPLNRSCGYDHNFVLNRKKTGDLEFAASLYEPSNGRYMEVWSTEPGLQFYSGNLFDGTIRGKKGKSYKHCAALALETQHFPDSPNQTGFPNTILRPTEVYIQTCIYQFSIK